MVPPYRSTQLPFETLRVVHICRGVKESCAVTATYLKDSGQCAVGSVGTFLVREPPAAEAVHGVGGDGLAELLEGVVPVPALFDLVEQLGQLACHCVV